METYTKPDGSVRTTCREGRTLGYYVAGHSNGVPIWACRGCHERADQHETLEEVAERLNLTGVLRAESAIEQRIEGGQR